MRFQKGQSVVEFALVLPIFLLLVYGVFYMGMIFADYITLNDVARSSAREASIINDDADYAYNYRNIRTKYSDVKLPLDVFTWTVSTTNFKINYDKNNHSVKVVLYAPLNKDGAGIANTFYKLIGSTEQDFSLNVTYTMYSEYSPTK